MGVRVAGIRVASAAEPDEPLGTGRAIARVACYPLLTALAGGVSSGLLSLLDVLWMNFDWPLRQGVHDKIAGTVVLYTR